MGRSPELWSRRQTLQYLSQVTAGLAGGLVLHGCTTSQSSTQSSTGGNSVSEKKGFSLGIVSWIGFTPFFIAQEKGFFQTLGIDIDLKTFATSPELNAAFLAGQLDGFTPVISETVLFAAKGEDYRIVLVEDTSVGADGILARTRIPNLQALKGQKIALEKGSVSHFFLLQVLKQVGLGEKDVTLVNTPPDASAAAYQAGNVDVAVTYAPFLQQANQAQPDGRILFDSSKMPTAIADLYAFKTDFVEQNPTLIQNFIKGVMQGLAFLQQNPQEGLAIAAKQLETQPEDLERDLKGLQLPDLKANVEMLGNPEGDRALLKSMTALAEFLVAQGEIETVPKMDKFLEPKFVKALLAES